MKHLVLCLVFASSCVPDAGAADAGFPGVEDPRDLDANGVFDDIECQGFDPDRCDDRCPICTPGTIYPCLEAPRPCLQNEHRLYCLDDEDASLAPPTLSVEEVNVLVAVLAIPLEAPPACDSGGFLWTAHVVYFGVGVDQLRIALEGDIVFEGPFRPVAPAEPEDGDPVLRLGRIAEADVCLPLAPDDERVDELRVAGQLFSAAGQVSMTQCGRLFPRID